MKKLTGALVLSFSLLLASGCRSAGETKDGEDASTPSQDASTGTSTGALTGTPSGGTPADTAQPGAGGEVQPGKPGAGEGAVAPPQTDEVRAAQERCLDTWLKGKKLDPYGNADGTMYAGGSPLFNEATGESKDRLEFVYQKQPEAKKACASAGTQAPAPTK